MAKPDETKKNVTPVQGKKPAKTGNTEAKQTAKPPKEASAPQQGVVEPERRSVFVNPLVWVIALLAVLLLGGGTYWGVTYQGDTNKVEKVAKKPDGTAQNALNKSDGPVNPAVDKGVTSWTDWGTHSLKNSDMESSMLEAHAAKYHKYYAVMVANEKKGVSYRKWYPKGTKFVNCDYNRKNDGLYVFFTDTLKEGTWFLCFPDGTPAVKTACGNTVIIPVGKVTRKPVVKKPVVKKPAKKCTNQAGQYVKHGRQNPATNVGSTKGVVAGKPDKVYTQQQSEPKGGLTPTKLGTPGAGAGGVTPGGPGTGVAVADKGAGATIGGSIETTQN